jgi:hypothetical protein
VVIDRVDDVDGTVVVAAHPRARGSRCRRCGRVSTRVHSRYRRHLADLPVSGRPVEVKLTVRRFFCDHIDCSAGTFVEQVSGLTEPYARRGLGLQTALVAIGLALAGRPGSRLAIRLGMGASRSTLPHLRLVFPGAAPQPARRGNGRPDGLRRLRVTGRADSGWVVTVAGEIRSIAQIISRATRAG